MCYYPRATMIRLLLIAIVVGFFAPPGRGATLVAQDSQWRYLKGTAEASSPDPASWRQPSFDDSTWLPGAAPIYYGEPLNGTLLSDMQGGYTSVYFRQTFTV